MEFIKHTDLKRALIDWHTGTCQIVEYKQTHCQIKRILFPKNRPTNLEIEFENKIVTVTISEVELLGVKT
jgi:hypothetical protein